MRFLTADRRRRAARAGRIREAWDDDDAKAYLGTVVPDFPNFFCLYGPNLQPGHGGSLIFVVEMQVRYIMRPAAADGPSGASAASSAARTSTTPTTSASTQAHENMVWTHPGMSTYYRNGRGRVVVN